jgi:hypothetical protein
LGQKREDTDYNITNKRGDMTENHEEIIQTIRIHYQQIYVTTYGGLGALIFAVPEIEPRALHLLDKQTTT